MGPTDGVDHVLDRREETVGTDLGQQPTVLQFAMDEMGRTGDRERYPLLLELSQIAEHLRAAEVDVGHATEVEHERVDGRVGRGEMVGHTLANVFGVAQH